MDHGAGAETAAQTVLERAETAVAPADVVIVDDHEGVREAMAMLLSVEGYEVRAFGHAEDALRYLQENPAPHLILLDLQMPGMNGWELAGRLRENGALQSAAVVLLSGVHDIDRQALNLEADGFLRKPVDPHILLRIAEMYCN
jgi:CheY-like chemotaxis protein